METNERGRAATLVNSGNAVAPWRECYTRTHTVCLCVGVCVDNMGCELSIRAVVATIASAPFDVVHYVVRAFGGASNCATSSSTLSIDTNLAEFLRRNCES